MLKTLHSLALQSVKVLWILVVLLLVSPSKASAYADPGTGAFVYQAMYAAFVGGAFYFRKILTRIWPKRK